MSNTSSDTQVLVAGGGIGGIAAALALVRRGFTVKVLEQAPQLGEIGAGIQLGPSAFAAFDALGIGEISRGRAVYTDEMVMFDALDEYQVGRIATGEAFRQRFGNRYAVIHRADVLGSLASAGPMEQTGRVRFLALAGPTREPTYPKVPATAELPSMRGYEVSAWTGIFAPLGTAPAVRERIAADIAEALAGPDTIERYKALGYERPDFSTAAYAQLIQRETSAWATTIKNANLRLD